MSEGESSPVLPSTKTGEVLETTSSTGGLTTFLQEEDIGIRSLTLTVLAVIATVLMLQYAVFNSIPYLGPVIVTGGLGIVTFVQFDTLLTTAYVCGVAFAITSLEGFLLTPVLMGRAAQMNPVAIFVRLLFWSWIWGLWGTVLAVPMLMMLKAICDHVEDLQPVGELLGE